MFINKNLINLFFSIFNLKTLTLSSCTIKKQSRYLQSRVEEYVFLSLIRSIIEIYKDMNIEQKIQEKIKEAYFELISEEELQDLVKKEIDKFFNEEVKSNIEIVTSKNGWHAEPKTTFEVSDNMSPFQKMVWMKMVSMTHDVLNKEIVKEYFDDKWSISSDELNEKTSKLITDAVPLAINTYFTNISKNMVNILQQQIRNNSY